MPAQISTTTGAVQLMGFSSKRVSSRARPARPNISSFGVRRHPLLEQGMLSSAPRWGSNKVSPPPRNYSRNCEGMRAIVAAEFTSRRLKCDFPLPMWRCRRCRTIPAGRSSGATPSRRRPMTRSSSAPAGTGSRPPITSPRSTASATSRCWRRAGSAAATPGATPRSSAPTTCGRNRPRSMSMR